MAKKILEVVNITSAPDWYLTQDEGASYHPVACWALVVLFDDLYPALGAERVVVGVKSGELDSISGIDPDGRTYTHSSEFEPSYEDDTSSSDAREH
jgi:hypothetical protein